MSLKRLTPSRGVTLVLVIALLVSMLPAMTASAQEVRTVSVDGLLVYAEPNAASQLVAVMSLGSSISVFGEVQNTFTRVGLPDGRQGWAQLGTDGVPQGAAVSSDPAFTGTVVEARGNIRIRSEAGLNGVRLGFVPWGEKANLLATSPDGLWYRINYAGIDGWVDASWFVIVAGNGNVAVNDDTVIVAGAPVEVGVATVEVSNATGAGNQVQARGNIRVRSEPSLAGIRLGFVPWGGVATLNGYSDDGEWINITYRGLTGWSAAAFWSIGVANSAAAEAVAEDTTLTVDVPVVTESTNVSSPTGVVVRSLGNVRVRNAPSLEGERIGGLAWGVEAAALDLSDDGEWMLISVGGVEGWVASAWLQVIAGNPGVLQ